MRRFLLSSATTILVLLGSAVATSPAHAAVVDLVCTATNVATYNPPLTNSPHDSTVTTVVDYQPCVSTTHPQITSGGRTGSFPVFDRSCVELLNPGATTTLVTTWNTGQTSTLTTSSTTTLAGVIYTVVATGTVSAGLFQGASATLTFTGPSLDITLCLLGLGGVSQLQTAGTLVLTG